MILFSCPRCQSQAVSIVITENDFQKPDIIVLLYGLKDDLPINPIAFILLEKPKVKSYLQCDACGEIWNEI